MCLSGVIRATRGEHLSLISLKWLTKFFVTGDIIGLMILGVGELWVLILVLIWKGKGGEVC
jgi:hypothetical protein